MAKPHPEASKTKHKFALQGWRAHPPCRPHSTFTHLPSTFPPTDAGLYRDLLRKARGDRALADRWLAEIGASAPAGDDDGNEGADAACTDLDTHAADAGAPPTFFCPIALTLFRDPVMLPTGQSYERVAIERWLAAGNATCPATGQRLGRPVPLTPNVALRRSVEDWCGAHMAWALGSDGHVQPLPAAEGEEATAAGEGGGGSTRCGAGGGAQQPPSDPALAEALRRQEAEWAALQAAAAGRSPGPPPGGPGGGPPWPRPPPIPLWAAAARPPPPYPRPAPPSALARAGRTAATLSLYALEGALLAAFIVALWKNGWGVAPLSTNPMVGASPATLYSLGAKATPALIAGQWWRLAASAGLTAGAIDLLATLTLALSLGRLVGRSAVAPWLTVPAIFVGGSALGCLASANLLPRAQAVGAPSGAAALWGAAAAFQALHWRAYAHRPLSALILVLVGAALAAIGLTPLHDNWYTAGAAGAGALAAGVVGRPGGPEGGGWARRPVGAADAAAGAAAAGAARTPPLGRRPAGRIFGSLVFRTACLGGLAAAASLGVIGLTKGGASVGDACAAWCPKIGCLPTKWWECGGGSGGGGGGGGGSTLSPGGPAGIPACSFSQDSSSGQTKVACPSGAAGFIDGREAPGSEADRLAACRKVCEPWRPVEVPKDNRPASPPSPAETPAAKYDPTAGVLV